MAPAPKEEEPRWLRRLRWWRLAFDLAFPPVVLTLATIVPAYLLLFTDRLSSPQAAGTYAGILVTLAGVVWKVSRR